MLDAENSERENNDGGERTGRVVVVETCVYTEKILLHCKDIFVTLDYRHITHGRNCHLKMLL